MNYDFYQCNKKKNNKQTSKHGPPGYISQTSLRTSASNNLLAPLFLTVWHWICEKQGHFWKYMIQTILGHFCLSDCWHLCVDVTWIGKQGLEFPHMCRQLIPSKKAALLVLWGVKEMSWSIYWPQSTSIWEYTSSSKRHSLEICIMLLLTSRTLKYDWCDV